MSNSENAKVEIELAQAVSANAEMTDSGDHTVFTKSGAAVWSGKSGYSPSIKLDGISSGRNLLSGHDDNNTVTVSAFKAYLAGVEHTISAGTAVAVRPASDVAKVCSVTLDSDGSTINVVEGSDGSDTTFSETRGADGGPPLIPAGDIEIGQIRMTSSDAAAIVSSEIFQVDGTHTERSDTPSYTENGLGEGADADSTAKTNAYIEFSTALDERHTGETCRPVYAEVYTPVFAEIEKAVDFAPAEISHSSSTTEYYRKTIASASESLGQASFTVGAGDGITDPILRQKNETVTVRFFPNEDEDPYNLTQGKLGVSRTYPKTDQNTISCTITPEIASVDFSS